MSSVNPGGGKQAADIHACRDVLILSVKCLNRKYLIILLNMIKLRNTNILL